MTATLTLLDAAPRPYDADAMYDAFVDWAAGRGFALYPAQDEAVIEIVSGSNVILSTPTGTGKSLVAVAALGHVRERAVVEDHAVLEDLDERRALVLRHAEERVAHPVDHVEGRPAEGAHNHADEERYDEQLEKDPQRGVAEKSGQAGHDSPPCIAAA